MSTSVEERITGASDNKMQVVVAMSLCTKERLEVIANYAKRCREVEGEMWEVGVYMGGSASLIGKMAPDKPLRLFDSFEGVSEPCEKDMPTQYEGTDGPMWKGEWHGDMKRTLVNVGRDCMIHKGWVPETFKDVPPDVKIAFCHIDVDLYQPTFDSLCYVLPRLSEGGYIVVDDFQHPRNPGVEQAIQELLPLWPKLKGCVETPLQVVLRLDKD